MGDPQSQPDYVFDLLDRLETAVVNIWKRYFNPPYNRRMLAKMCAQDLIENHMKYTSDELYF